MPIFLIILVLSTVLIWLNKIVESLFSFESFLKIKIFVGNSLSKILEVIGATIVTGLNWFPKSFWTIKTGLSPPCSLPIFGFKSTRTISPRLIFKISHFPQI